MTQIKITHKQFKKVLNEVIGFTTDYEHEAEDELKQFIDVVQGPIANLVNTKSIHSDNVLAQRIYQLCAEGGELHVLTQELIDILEALPDRKQEIDVIGFKRKGERNN